MNSLLELINKRLEDLIDKRKALLASELYSKEEFLKENREAYAINARIYVNLTSGTKFEVEIEDLMEIYEGTKTLH